MRKMHQLMISDEDLYFDVLGNKAWKLSHIGT